MNGRHKESNGQVENDMIVSKRKESEKKWSYLKNEYCIYSCLLKFIEYLMMFSGSIEKKKK